MDCHASLSSEGLTNFTVEGKPGPELSEQKPERLIDSAELLREMYATIKNWHLGTEVLVALQRRFFGSWHSLSPLPQEKPAIYALNHQVGCDLALLSAPIAFRTPFPATIVVADSASDSQHGKLLDFLLSHPLYAVEDDKMRSAVIEFDPGHPAKTKLAVEQMRETLKRRSIIVAIEGKAQSRDEQIAVQASSLLPNLSLRTGCPIVPMRVSGGLSQTPSHFRAFPFDYGHIHAVSGATITPERLREMEPRSRIELLLREINSLIGLSPEKSGVAENSSPDFAQSVAERQVRTGSSAVKCAIIEMLVRGPILTQEGRDLLTLFEPAVRQIPASLNSGWERRFVGWLTDGLNMPEGPEKYEYLSRDLRL